MDDNLVLKEHAAHAPESNDCESDVKQKRSKHIDLSLMRKEYRIKPIAISIASIFLASCADNRQDAMVFTDLADCTAKIPENIQACEVAYEQALRDAADTAPKYGSQRDCEHDFGSQQCVPYRSDTGNSWFMPLMAGYMIRDILEPRRYSQPLFTSYSRYSPYRHRWIGANGYDYGDFRYRDLKVSKDYSKPPKVNRTIKRGGFGSSVRAKSSWGSSSKGGWGG